MALVDDIVCINYVCKNDVVMFNVCKLARK